MGLTRRQILTRVELPLALPAMIGGLRIAVVSTIAIATIAATILPKGLGFPIFYAIQLPTPFKTEIYSAGRAGGRARAHLRRRARRPAAGGHPVVQGLPVTLMSSDPAPMIFDAATPHTFVEALRFIVDNPHLLVTKALEQLELSGAAHRRSRCSSRSRSGSSSGTSTAARGSRSAPRSSGAPSRASS